MGRRVSESLRLQLFCSVLVSLAVGAAVFGASFLMGNSLLDKTAYGHSFAEKMADQQFSKLQDFVEKERVSLDSLQRLNAWCSRGEKVYLAIYHGDDLVYLSHAFGTQGGDPGPSEADPGAENPDSEYVLTLQSGVKVRAFLYYYAGDAYYFWMIAASGLLAFGAFSLCFVTLITRKAAYIARLKEELDILASGQLEYPVTIAGKDELSELAFGIDQMRRSILRHQRLEERMRSANSELITAMSHDLRTPLTALLAYLEILERKKYRDEQQVEDLIRRCVRQVSRIGRMADELFAYSYAYSTEWQAADMDDLDAGRLFRRIVGDCVHALEGEGMRVEAVFDDVPFKVRVNVEMLQRVSDNLYSNVLKHADPEGLVRFSVTEREGSVCLLVTNAVRAGLGRDEGTGIGLITCRRIVELHGGDFSVESSDGCFSVSVSLPALSDAVGGRIKNR